jgi:predicted dehydrogenase
MSIRLGAIGVGAGLGRLTIRLCQEEGAEIVAGADVSRNARNGFETAFDAPAYEEYGEMLAAHDLDAVTIVTPHALHHEQAAACLDAGLHVHVEKPLTTTVADGVDLVERADAADCVLQVGYQRHFTPVYRELRRLVGAGRIGAVQAASCYLAQDWIDNQGGVWRSDPALSGGGQLVDSGSHLLDALLWTTDTTPGPVAAVVDRQGHDVDVNSAVAATLRGERPVTASIAVVGDGDEFEESLRIWGTEGQVAFDGTDLTVVENGRHYTADLQTLGWEEQNRRKLAAFLESVEGDHECAVPGSHGVRGGARSRDLGNDRRRRGTDRDGPVVGSLFNRWRRRDSRRETHRSRDTCVGVDSR